MKKFILAGIMIFGILSFATKITTNNALWKQLWKAEVERRSAVWTDKNEAYKFLINEDENKLYQVYENQKIVGGEVEESTGIIFGKYDIHFSGKKGIYYVNNFVDLKGKVRDKLYFGFDEKLKTIVIVDKNGNILEKLEMVMAN